MPRRRGRRNRERRPKPVRRWEWVYRGRAFVTVEFTSRGPLLAQLPDRDRVDDAAKESAAWWLNQIFRRLSNDECYAILWGP